MVYILVLGAWNKYKFQNKKSGSTGVLRKHKVGWGYRLRVGGDGVVKKVLLIGDWTRPVSEVYWGGRV